MLVHVNFYGNGTDFTCPTDDVTVEMVGWFPGTGYPTRTDGYGAEIEAISTSAQSPWQGGH
jgi:hypothetical protein